MWLIFVKKKVQKKSHIVFDFLHGKFFSFKHKILIEGNKK